MRVVRHSKLVLGTITALWPAFASGQGTVAPAGGSVARASGATAPTPTKTPALAKAATAVAATAPPPGNAGGSPTQASSALPPGMIPFTLSEIYYFEPATGTRFDAQNWGNSYLLPVVDTLKQWNVTFLFTSNVPKQEIADIVEKRACCSALLVSNQSVTVNSLAFSGEKVFVRALLPDMQTWPKTVQLKLYHQGSVAGTSVSGGSSAPAGVGQSQAPGASRQAVAPAFKPFMDYRSAPMPVRSSKVSYFSKFLYATFANARCTDCHAMGDEAAVRAQHDKAGILNVDARNAHVAGCGNTSCHNLVNDWRTPPFSFGINWKGRSAKEICTIVTNHLPTANALHQHFNNDPRVIWAVSSGWVPRQNPLPTAPPHNAQAWLQLINYWIDGGFPCP